MNINKNQFGDESFEPEFGDESLSEEDFFSSPEIQDQFGKLELKPDGLHGNSPEQVEEINNQAISSSRVSSVGEVVQSAVEKVGRGLAFTFGGIVALAGGAAAVTASAALLVLRMTGQAVGAAVGAIGGIFVGIAKGDILEGIKAGALQGAKGGDFAVKILVALVSYPVLFLSLQIWNAGVAALESATDNAKMIGTLDSAVDKIVKFACSVQSHAEIFSESGEVYKKQT